MPKEICAWAAEAEARSSAERAAVCRSLFMIGGYCHSVTWICPRLHRTSQLECFAAATSGGLLNLLRRFASLRHAPQRPSARAERQLATESHFKVCAVGLGRHPGRGCG